MFSILNLSLALSPSRLDTVTVIVSLPIRVFSFQTQPKFSSPCPQGVTNRCFKMTTLRLRNIIHFKLFLHITSKDRLTFGRHPVYLTKIVKLFSIGHNFLINLHILWTAKNNYAVNTCMYVYMRFNLAKQTIL
jgi:hypothetical protein